MDRSLFARWMCGLAILAAVGCEAGGSTPLSPGAANGGGTAVNPDGSTLKVTAPAPQSPVGGAKLDTRRPVLVTANATGRHVAVTTLDYQFQVTDGSGSVVHDARTGQGSGTTQYELPVELEYATAYTWRVRARLGNDDVGPWSSAASFVTVDPPPPPSPTPTTPTPSVGPRRPPNGPLPFGLPIINQVAAQYPGALANSCQEHGGSWDFMDLVIDTLRAVDDTRWGYNWKRGFHQGYSQDVIDYNWGDNPDEGSERVYIIDIITGHCGSNPSPTWSDVTPFGAGRWTSRGRF